MGKILKRKIEKILEDYYANDPGKILLVDGARQTGKSFIIRQTASQRFRNYIEVNLFEDRLGAIRSCSWMRFRNTLSCFLC